MREKQFIRQNEEKWRAYEETLRQNEADPADLSELYIHITDDLSYSRTFYPNRAVRVYLNEQAQRIFLRIFRGRKRERFSLSRFWLRELPLTLYEHRRAFWFSLLTFAVAMLIGVLSFRVNPEFANVMLGDDYMRMTQENIANGDPMRVYKARGEFGMFLGITMNNIYVAFLTFLSGVFFGVGTFVILIQNAIMLGAFQFFFYDQGLLQESFLTIWIHGALEISSIVIAGAAGITMGRGLVFPGTYTRIQSFQRSARAAVKIMLSTVPIFVVAGFLESYLTRHTELPDVIRGLFILLCFATVGFYYVWYPRRVAREQEKIAPEAARRIPGGVNPRLDFGRIRRIGTVLSDAFQLLRRHLALAATGAGVAALGYCALRFGLAGAPPTEVAPLYEGLFSGIITAIDLYAWSTGEYTKALAVFFHFFVLLYVACRIVERERGEALPGPGPTITALAAPALMLSALALFPYGTSLLIGLLFGAVPMVWAYLRFSGIGWGEDSIALNFRYYARLYGYLAIVAVLGWIFLGLVDSAVIQQFFQLVNWLVYAGQATLNEWSTVLYLLVFGFLVGLLGLLAMVGVALTTHSLREIEEASALRNRIQAVGEQKTLRGFAKE